MLRLPSHYTFVSLSHSLSLLPLSFPSPVCMELLTCLALCCGVLCVVMCCVVLCGVLCCAVLL
jgi:hypothetical protein